MVKIYLCPRILSVVSVNKQLEVQNMNTNILANQEYKMCLFFKHQFMNKHG